MKHFVPTPNFWTLGLVYYCETIQIDMFYLNGWISTRAFVSMQTIKDVNSLLLLFKWHLLYKMKLKLQGFAISFTMKLRKKLIYISIQNLCKDKYIYQYILSSKSSLSV